MIERAVRLAESTTGSWSLLLIARHSSLASTARLRHRLRQQRAKTRDQRRDALQRVIDFGVRRVSRQAEADAAVRDRAVDAHRRQHVRGLQRAARAGGAGGGGDAVLRKRDDDRLGLDRLEADVGRVADAVLTITIDVGEGDSLQQAGFKAVAQAADAIAYGRGIAVR